MSKVAAGRAPLRDDAKTIRPQRPVDVTVARSGVTRNTRWIWVEAGAAVAVGLVTAVAATRQLSGQWEIGMLAVTALLAWAITVYHAGTASVTTLAPKCLPVIRSSTYVLAALMLPVALGLVIRADAAPGAAAVVSAASVTLIVRRVGMAISGPVRLLLVGDAGAVALSARRWSASDATELAGVFVVHSPGSQDAAPDGLVDGLPVLSIADVVEQARLRQADAVLVADGVGFGAQDLRQLAWELRAAGSALAAVSVAETIAPHRIRPARLAGGTVLDVAPAQRSGFILAVKAAIDRVLGAMLLMLAAPVLGLLVILIRIDSPGPGIFLQTRVGREGKPFRIFKLRTMAADAESSMRLLFRVRNDGDGAHFKIQQDPRVTRLGRFLRVSSLDELPQLINVVLGDMSLVGPRPATALEVANYDAIALQRLAVKPGMTGRWQVSGRSNLSWTESVRLDVDYIDNWRLTQDLTILARTAGVVLRRKGAY